MKKTLIAIPACLALIGCSGGAVDSDYLVEDAAMTSALTADEYQEDLDAVPSGDVGDAANEAADETGEIGEPLRQCNLTAFRDEVIRQYDADGDGTLNDAERDTLRQDFEPNPLRIRRRARFHRLARLKWVYDANEDRILDDAERQEMRNDLEMRCENRKAQLIAAHDADGDGVLNDAEWEQARLAIRARLQARWQAVIDQFDANNDGVLDLMERQRLMESRRQHFQTQRDAVKAQYDVDGDGILDATERAAIREFLKSRVRGEHFGQ